MAGRHTYSETRIPRRPGWRQRSPGRAVIPAVAARSRLRRVGQRVKRLTDRMETDRMATLWQCARPARRNSPATKAARRRLGSPLRLIFAAAGTVLGPVNFRLKVIRIDPKLDGTASSSSSDISGGLGRLRSRTSGAHQAEHAPGHITPRLTLDLPRSQARA